MSRSYRKNVFSCIVCHGIHAMKQWRSKENRRLRHNSKQLINTCEDYDALIIPVLNDYDTMWGSPQDGRKHYVEKPALNQCEVDLEKAMHRARRWYFDRQDILDKRIEKERKSYIHGSKYCDCYSNKRYSWYWKVKRK